MDSLSHLALGSAIGLVVMRGRTTPWKAALVGAACNTLPDLDVFLRHSDAIAAMTQHRGSSHALFWLAAASPVVALAAAAALGELDRFRRWWLAVFLSMISHPLVDVFTVYGTRLWLPFSDKPQGLGSIFIIDPLFTLPLVIGAGAALLSHGRRWRWAVAGLVLAFAFAYLGFGALVQQHVRRLAAQSLQAQGIAAERILVTPAPFTSLLWRIVAVTPRDFHEGFYSLFDRDRTIAFECHPRGAPLYADMRSNPHVARLAAFSGDFFKMHEHYGLVMIADLRMGQEPYYSFDFVVGQRQNPAIVALTPARLGGRPPLREGLPWLWRRMLGEPLPPPH
jgi:inner membrane protein